MKVKFTNITGSKYGNKKCQIDGCKFDSKKEMNRYLELKLLLRAGKISELTLQPKFLLQDKFKKDGKTFREINYISDFRYLDKLGKIVVEDVKGFKTDIYNLKKKLFLFKYPIIIFIEI